MEMRKPISRLSPKETRLGMKAGAKKKTDKNSSKQLTPAQVYGKFFKQFWSDGYLSDLLYTRDGNKVFEFEGKTLDKTELVKEYLDKNKIKFSIGKINRKKLLIYP